MAFDPYHEWLGIPAAEQPPNHYRLLSIPQFENSPKVIETAADRQMGHLRNYQTGEHSALSQKLLNEVAAARVCLLNAEKKAAYDQKLRAQLKARQKAIPTAKPLDAEPVTKPVDAGLEQLFAKTDQVKPVGKTPAARNKQTQLWTITGIVAVGLLALVFILIRVTGSSSSKPSTPSPVPVAQSDPPKAPKAPALAKKPVESETPVPETPEAVTPVNNTPRLTPASVQGNGPAPPPAVAPFEVAKAKEYQEAWAKYLGVPVVGTNSIGMKFVLIPPGEFEMGAREEEIAWAIDEGKKAQEPSWFSRRVASESPQHRVSISRPFYLGVFEVTQAEYERVMGDNPSSFSATGSNAAKLAVADTRQCPVDSVSWENAREFCRRLSALDGERIAAREYRLPTEAEWEYSCRAGSTEKWFAGNDPSRLDDFGWNKANSGGSPRPVGLKRPNAWGLHDTVGNVREWCSDWYGEFYYKESPSVDPLGPPSGTHRVQRGGSMMTGPHFTCSAFRLFFRPDEASTFAGFRVVVGLDTGKARADRPEQASTTQNPATPAPPAAEKPSRLPVPSAEDQAKITAQLKDLFELDKDRTPEERKKLAGDLVELAAKSEKPAERYVLLVSAAQLDCQAGDGAAALRAVDKLAEAFDVDALALKASLIKKLAAEAGDSAAILAMLDAADAVIDAAMAQEKYDVALELVEEAYKACAQGTGRDHRKRAFDRRKEVQALAASWQQVQAALEELKTTPDDPEANLAAGRYYCFDQGDWDKGLPCLAKSSDAELKKLAEEELNSPPADADAMLKLADAWWDLSEARQGSEHDALMLRAGTWYREAQPAITSTLVKAKVDKRLEEIEKLGRAILEPARLGPPPPAIAPFDANQAKRHQERWAKYLGLPVETTNSIGMKLVLIPPGEFEMGSTQTDIEAQLKEVTGDGQPELYASRVRGQGPQHCVRITKAFRIGVYEVTIAQFREFVQAARYETDAKRTGAGARKEFHTTDDCPMGDVSCDDAIAFCKWLSSKEGTVYRLPTEAEWEYTCRAGTTTRFFFGDEEKDLDEYAWWRGNSGDVPHPVGQKRPNAWGLYEVHGNIMEWCSDWLHWGYYAQSPKDDPTGPSPRQNRVFRGGTFHSANWELSSVYRTGEKPSRPTYLYGFRVVCEINVQPPDPSSQSRGLPK